MLHIDNQTGQKIDTKLLNSIYESLTHEDIELLFVTDEAIQEVNLEFRGKNSPTDVLSFPLQNIPNCPLGSILISIDTAQKISSSLNHSLEEEISLLFIHGFLHLSGYDHEVDNGEMRNKEEELIKKFNLPKSLIVRTLD